MYTKINEQNGLKIESGIKDRISQMISRKETDQQKQTQKITGKQKIDNEMAYKYDLKLANDIIDLAVDGQYSIEQKVQIYFKKSHQNLVVWKVDS